MKSSDENGREVNDFDEGEIESDEDSSSRRRRRDGDKKTGKEAPAAVEVTKESEEEGEINDGEKVKKAFIPRVLCKYYQRGKCTWGRGCKFLHPGVNDTGNYSFLEFQDPNLKLYQQAQQQQQAAAAAAAAKSNSETDLTSSAEPNERPSTGAADNQPIQTESAWERGLRHAKEMKERAKRRKQMEKDQFDDKKMNLSLKDFENEKDNDERYINAERYPFKNFFFFLFNFIFNK